jgi:hypothetical protein
MLLSISNSKASGTSARAGIFYLLLALTLFSIALELAANVAFARISRIQGRIVAEYQAAHRLRPMSAEGKPTLLLVGNSLLLEGLDLPKTQAAVRSRYDVSRLVVEQTQYLDWFFGIRRLLNEGARPSIVMLTLPTGHLISTATRGEYFARYQMQARDILEVAQASHLDTTTASNYWFAHFSGWLGSKAEIRKWFLAHALGNLDALASRVTNRADPLPPDEAIEAILLPRFQAAKAVCDRAGARFAVMLPPVLDSHEKIQGVISACRRAGIHILVPYTPGELTGDYYRDGFHLNAAGEDLFTTRVCRLLPASNW